MVVVKIN